MAIPLFDCVAARAHSLMLKGGLAEPSRPTHGISENTLPDLETRRSGHCYMPCSRATFRGIALTTAKLSY
jgi:hypothetical protein